MRLPRRPPLESAEFPRWLNGRVTRFCGKGFHESREGSHCKGTISTLGIECPCLCKCHAVPVQP